MDRRVLGPVMEQHPTTTTTTTTTATTTRSINGGRKTLVPTFLHTSNEVTN